MFPFQSNRIVYASNRPSSSSINSIRGYPRLICPGRISQIIDGKISFIEDHSKHQIGDYVWTPPSVMKFNAAVLSVAHRYIKHINPIELEKMKKMFLEWKNEPDKLDVNNMYRLPGWRAIYTQNLFLSRIQTVEYCLNQLLEIPAAKSALNKVSTIVSLGCGPGPDIASTITVLRSLFLRQHISVVGIDQFIGWCQYIVSMDSVDDFTTITFKKMKIDEDSVKNLEGGDMCIMSYTDAAVHTSKFWEQLKEMYNLILILDQNKHELCSELKRQNFETVQYQLKGSKRFFYFIKPSEIETSEVNQCLRNEGDKNSNNIEVLNVNELEMSSVNEKSNKKVSNIKSIPISLRQLDELKEIELISAEIDVNITKSKSGTRGIYSEILNKKVTMEVFERQWQLKLEQLAEEDENEEELLYEEYDDMFDDFKSMDSDHCGKEDTLKASVSSDVEEKSISSVSIKNNMTNSISSISSTSIRNEHSIEKSCTLLQKSKNCRDKFSRYNYLASNRSYNKMANIHHQTSFNNNHCSKNILSNNNNDYQCSTIFNQNSFMLNNALNMPPITQQLLLAQQQQQLFQMNMQSVPNFYSNTLNSFVNCQNPQNTSLQFAIPLNNQIFPTNNYNPNNIVNNPSLNSMVSHFKAEFPINSSSQSQIYPPPINSNPPIYPPLPSNTNNQFDFHSNFRDNGSQFECRNLTTKCHPEKINDCILDILLSKTDSVNHYNPMHGPNRYSKAPLKHKIFPSDSSDYSRSSESVNSVNIYKHKKNYIRKRSSSSTDSYEKYQFKKSEKYKKNSSKPKKFAKNNMKDRFIKKKFRQLSRSQSDSDTNSNPKQMKKSITNKLRLRSRSRETIRQRNDLNFFYKDKHSCKNVPKSKR